MRFECSHRDLEANTTTEMKERIFEDMPPQELGEYRQVTSYTAPHQPCVVVLAADRISADKTVRVTKSVAFDRCELRYAGWINAEEAESIWRALADAEWLPKGMFQTDLPDGVEFTSTGEAAA